MFMRFEQSESMEAERDACKLPRRLRCDPLPCQTDFDCCNQGDHGCAEMSSKEIFRKKTQHIRLGIIDTSN